MPRVCFHRVGKPIRFPEDVYDDVLGGYDCLDGKLDRFVVSSLNNNKLVCFDTWSRLEDLLSERLSFEEYSYLDQLFSFDTLTVSDVDIAFIRRLKAALCEFRVFK